jgi:serine-type D-Ala-D-Ala carboxypeptidase (penicillin-binding protein 5/6)
VVFGGLALVLATAFYLPITLLAPIGSTAAAIAPYDAPVSAEAQLDFPGYGATAVGAIGFPGTLAESGSADPVPIASISKVITALVVLDRHPLELGEEGPTITFTSKDVQLYYSYLRDNGKIEPVRSGISLTQHQVMQLTLVASANNYAASLVNWAFGSEAEYAAAANAWLAAHGLTHTSMSDATGMSPQNTSTAADLVELGKLALSNPVVSELVSTKHISIPGVGEIDNTNDLLGENGVRGIKTGTLDEAGACLLFAADYQIGSETVTVVGVMLGGKDHPSLDADIRALLGGVAAGFHEVDLVTAGQQFGSYTTIWGDSAQIVATQNASLLVWSATTITVLIEAHPLGLAEAGTDVGKLTFSAGSEVVTVPLEIDTTIDDPGPEWRLTHPGDLL